MKENRQLKENKHLIQAYFDALNRDKRVAIETYVADAQLREHILLFEEGLPGYQLYAEDMVAEDDKVVVRGHVVGTHAGTLFGVPASGGNVKVPLILIYRIAEGRIVDHWMQADTLSLMQQIGAVPAAEMGK